MSRTTKELGEVDSYYEFSASARACIEVGKKAMYGLEFDAPEIPLDLDDPLVSQLDMFANPSNYSDTKVVDLPTSLKPERLIRACSAAEIQFGKLLDDLEEDPKKTGFSYVCVDEVGTPYALKKAHSYGATTSLTLRGVRIGGYPIMQGSLVYLPRNAENRVVATSRGLTVLGPGDIEGGFYCRPSVYQFPLGQQEQLANVELVDPETNDRTRFSPRTIEEIAGIVSSSF